MQIIHIYMHWNYICKFFLSCRNWI